MTGTHPGVKLLEVSIPLVPDPYTEFTIGNPNTRCLNNLRRKLDARGLAAASFIVPPYLPGAAGFTFYHA